MLNIYWMVWNNIAPFHIFTVLVTPRKVWHLERNKIAIFHFFLGIENVYFGFQKKEKKRKNKQTKIKTKQKNKQKNIKFDNMNYALSMSENIFWKVKRGLPSSSSTS